MKLKNYKTSLLLATSVFTLASVSGHSVESIFAEENPSMKYIEGADEEESSQRDLPQVENRSQEQVSMDEGIAAEQIIVKITEDGYVTSHGDHYHFYSGDVPFDAIFVESIVTDAKEAPESDRVSEIQEGWIIKEDDQLKVWLNNGKDSPSVRTTEELTLQANGVDPEDAKRIVALKRQLQVSEESLLIPEIDKTPEEVTKEKDSDEKHVVIYVTDKYFVTMHDIDFHLFAGQVPDNIKFSEHVLPPADYQWDKNDVVYDVPGGHVVKVKNRYFVYLNSGKADKNVITDKVLKAQAEKSYQAFNKAGKMRKEVVETVKPGEVGGSGSRNDSGAYVTSDGYVFSPYDVIQDLGDGFIVPHGNHYHFIPKADLTSSELSLAMSVLHGRSQGSGSAADKQPVSGLPAKEKTESSQLGKNDRIDDEGRHGDKNDQGQYTTSDGYVYTVESIASVEANGVVAAHGNHFHWVPFEDLSRKELRQTQDYIAKHFGIHRNLVKEFAGGSSEQTLPNNPVKDPSEPSVTSESTTTEEDIPRPGKIKPKPDHHDSTESEETYASLLAKLYALPKTQRYTEADGLIFDPETIQKVVTLKGKRAYVVPHGDHHHVIYENDLSELEIKLARIKTGKSVLVQPGKPEAPIKETTQEPIEVTESSKQTTTEATSEVTTETMIQTTTDITETTTEAPITSEQSSDQPTMTSEVTTEASLETTEEPDKETSSEDVHRDKVDLLSKVSKHSPKGSDGKPYTTSDGYTFTPESIIQYDDSGLLTKHTDHTHYVPYEDLEPEELQAAQDYINGVDSVKEIEDTHFTSEEIRLKLSYLSIQNGVATSDLQVTGDQVIIPHGNHTHTIAMDDIPTQLKMSDFDTPQSYKNTILSLKISYIAQQEGKTDFLSQDDAVILYEKNGEATKIKLNDIHLPLNYEEVDFSDRVTPRHPQEAKLQYIADQYKIPRSHVKILFGDMVTVKGHPNVLLSKVDVNDPILYTLLQDEPNESSDISEETTESSSIEATTEESSDESVQEITEEGKTENNQEVNGNQKPSESALKTALAEHYSVAPSAVNYFSGMFIVTNPKPDSENIVIMESDAIAFYQGNKQAIPSSFPQAAFEAVETEDTPVSKEVPAHHEKEESSAGLDNTTVEKDHPIENVTPDEITPKTTEVSEMER